MVLVTVSLSSVSIKNTYCHEHMIHVFILCIWLSQLHVMIPDVGVNIDVEIPLHLSPQVIVISYGQRSSCWWQNGKDTIWTKKFLLVAKWERHNLRSIWVFGRLMSHCRYKHVILRTPNFASKDKLLVVEWIGLNRAQEYWRIHIIGLD